MKRFNIGDTVQVESAFSAFHCRIGPVEEVRGLTESGEYAQAALKSGALDIGVRMKEFPSLVWFNGSELRLIEAARPSTAPHAGLAADLATLEDGVDGIEARLRATEEQLGTVTAVLDAVLQRCEVTDALILYLLTRDEQPS